MVPRLLLIAAVYTLGVLTAPRGVIEARTRFITKLTNQTDEFVSDVKKRTK